MLERTTQLKTLIEKLEEKKSEVWQMMLADDAPFPYHYMAGKLNAFREIVNIVKQHSDWIPVSDLPKEEKDWLVRFRKEDGFGLTMAVSKFYLGAQRFDCFKIFATVTTMDCIAVGEFVKFDFATFCHD